MHLGSHRPWPIDRVAVVVPARNEALTIGNALTAIGRAADEVRPGVTVHVTVVDDGSVDGTSEAARIALMPLDVRWRVIRVREHCVGTARRVGIDATTAAWRRPKRAWILSTDADSRVRADWIVRHLRHACTGTPAVSGIVDIVDGETHSTFRDRWWADYGAQIDRAHRHPYSHATNLGVRLDAYRAVGGFADMAACEDADLWHRLRERGFAPVADARIVVDTSDRRVGRVRVGFAHALATLYPEPTLPTVNDPRPTSASG